MTEEAMATRRMSEICPELHRCRPLTRPSRPRPADAAAHVKRVRLRVSKADAVTRRTAILTALFAACAFGGVAADPAALQLAHADVRVVCPLTIGGSFTARTTAASGSVALAAAHPPAYQGDIVVDLRTLDTGIGLRNTHLRERYLEVDKGDGYDKAVVSGIQLPDVDASTFEGRTSFTATMRLHGTTKPIAGQLQIRREPSSIRVDAAFPLMLTDYGIAKPQYLGVGVRNEIQIRATFDLTPSAATVTSR
jgi:polyisoprenoid-binding protein YceI